MVSKNILLKDSVSTLHDLIAFPDEPNGFWARTEVIGSYGDVVNNPHGKSTFTLPPVFNKHNIVPVGGVSYVMQKLYEIPETQISIPTMHDPLNTDFTGGEGIGQYPNGMHNEVTNPMFRTPRLNNGVKIIRESQYPAGHHVCLFGIGITGSAENDVTIYHPDYRENKISIAKTSTDGKYITGTMLPFRYVENEASMSTEERQMYFGKKTIPASMVESGVGGYGYFLKRFENDPVIKHIWKTGEDVDEEIPVSAGDIWSNMSGLNAVESFVEIQLKISHKDVKDWFNAIEQPDRCRFNTIALFDGVYYDGGQESVYGDYTDVRMFSKLCINPEYLNLAKDLNILYRVYGA